MNELQNAVIIIPSTALHRIAPLTAVQTVPPTQARRPSLECDARQLVNMYLPADRTIGDDSIISKVCVQSRFCDSAVDEWNLGGFNSMCASATCASWYLHVGTYNRGPLGAEINFRYTHNHTRPHTHTRWRCLSQYLKTLCAPVYR